MLEGFTHTFAKLMYASLSQEVRIKFDQYVEDLYQTALKGNWADRKLAEYLEKLRRLYRG